MTAIEELELRFKVQMGDAIAKMEAINAKSKSVDKSALGLAKTFGKELFSGFMKFAGPAGAAMLVSQAFQKLIQYGKEAVTEFDTQ